MDIAIVGAGAAAVAFLDSMAHSAAEPGSVTVYEPSARLWRGRPYQPDLDTVLVNTPPSHMSIRHGDFGHYADWLGARGAAHLDELFGQPLVPRALYGDYLEHTAEKALAALRERGWRVGVVGSRVTATARAGSRLVLSTEDGGRSEVDRVVLCVGGGKPRDHHGLGNVDGFVADPYPLVRTLDRIPAHGAVAVVGSGLTAVDVVVSLAANGHTGPIHLVSRSGLLPHVWQRPVGYRPRHVTVERVAAVRERQGVVMLEDLARLLRTELSEVGESLDDVVAELLAARTEQPMRRLRRQLAAVDDRVLGRRILQEVSHTVGPFAWRLLPEADREWLRRHFRLATSLASPMVPVNAAEVARLLDSGQLVVVAGVRGVEAVGGRFEVRGDVGSSSAVVVADAVVNAVNPPPGAVPRGAESLVGSLVAGGLATTHTDGGLLAVDPRLDVVGDFAGGGSFITSGIAGIAAQGARAAARAASATG